MPIYYYNELQVYNSDKKVNKHTYMSGLFCASLAACIPNVTFSRTSLTTSYPKSSQPTPIEKVLRKKVQKQVNKKAFKINAKIEDVGLNEDLKKYGNKKWSLNCHDQPKSQNPTYCFFF